MSPLYRSFFSIALSISVRICALAERLFPKAFRERTCFSICGGMDGRTGCQTLGSQR